MVLPVVVVPARAVDAGRLGAEIEIFAGGRPVETAAFGFALPEVAESGYSVPMEIAAEGRAEAEGIAALRVLAPENPFVRVVTVEFGPTATGRFETRIRLARSQIVTALLRTGSGRVLREDRRVEVVVGGCGFDL